MTWCDIVNVVVGREKRAQQDESAASRSARQAGVGTWRGGHFAEADWAWESPVWTGVSSQSLTWAAVAGFATVVCVAGVNWYFLGHCIRRHYYKSRSYCYKLFHTWRTISSAHTSAKTKAITKCYNSLSPFYWPFSRWTWVSRCLLKQRMMEVVVTTGAVSHAKLQSNHHHQQTNIQFLGSTP